MSTRLLLAAFLWHVVAPLMVVDGIAGCIVCIALWLWGRRSSEGSS